MSFGEFIKKQRLKNNLTLRDVEERTHISNAYISQFENGKRKPPHPKILKSLANVYNIPFKTIMEEAGYLETDDELKFIEEAELDRALDYISKDLRLSFGKSLHTNIDSDIKRLIIELYENLTGMKFPMNLRTLKPKNKPDGTKSFGVTTVVTDPKMLATNRKNKKK